MSFPNFTFWSHLLATVSIEVCCLAALGFVAQSFFRSAVWQRAVRQMTVICLLLLPASEWTGFGRGAAGFLFGQKPAAESAPASGFTAVKSVAAGELVAANLKPPPAAARPAVWWPGWVWLAGVVLVLGRMAAAQVLLLALRLRREKIVTQSLRQRVVEVARSVGLRRRVSLLRMPETISPMAFGILRPSIGLPPEFEAKLSATEQEAVLAHELAHLAAMDPLWFLLADFASAWLWWHPLPWWVRRSLHGAAELAADEATVMVPDGPGALANCLVNLGKEMTAARGWSWVGINGGFRSKLGQRVERLMQMSGGVKRPWAGWAITAAKLAATILIVPTIVLLFGSFQSAHVQKEETLRGQLRKSWNSSPGARLMPPASDNIANQKVDSATLVEKAKLLYEKDKLLVLAALDDEAKLKVDIATWVRNAKFLYHMGKYDDAEAVLGAVMNKDPANRSAAYYLDLIKEARYMDRARRRAADVKRSVGIAEWGWDYTSSTNRSSHSMPYPIWNTNLVYTTKGRQHIISKLNNIMLDEVSFDLPLKDVLLKLRKESQKHDPDGVGINFMIQNVPGPTPGAQKDIGTDVRIKLSPPLQKLRMADVLDAITKVADSPIRYMVEDYAVVFSPKPLEAESLYTKSFRVDPNTFSQGLQNVTGVRLNLGAQAAAGGATIPQVTIGFDTQQGGIQASQTGAGGGQNGLSYVTRTNSTIEAHQLVAAYFAANGVILDPPKSVFFNDRLGEILVRASLDDLDKIQQSIELLNQTPPQVTIEAQFIEVDEAALQGLALDWNKPAQEFTGTMTAAQFRSALTAIEQHTSADVLSTPRVTTESGRQAHLGSSNGDEGVTLDVLPVVKPDGYFIQITASPAITVGHQTWQVKASGQVLDSQTMVIGGVVTNQLSGPKKVGVVFVTPTIIDPAGNRVHTDDDLAKPRKSGDQVQ